MSNLKDLLNKHNFYFSKKLGQNFISDKNLLSAIVLDSEITDKDTVLEIGCGAGSLTKELSKACKKVIGFEIDKSLKPILEENLALCKNVDIIYKDFLKFTDDEIINLTKSNFKVVANLPYYITTPIIMRLIESSLEVSSITVMVQKEVALRLCAKASTAEYGSVTVAVESFGNCKILRNISKNMFIPSPKVDSSLIRIDVDKSKFDITDINHYRKLYRSAFSMRRKTFLNNIISAFDYSKEKILESFSKFNLRNDIRGESLTAEQFMLLSNYLVLTER